MRLWHKGLLSALPDKKLLTLWHDCCTIARNLDLIGTPNDMYVNRITEYPLSHFYAYTMLVVDEIGHRGIAVTATSYMKFEDHIFKAVDKSSVVEDDVSYDAIFYDWHDDRYLWQCMSMLEEEFDCGGITIDDWQKVQDIALLYTSPFE